MKTTDPFSGWIPCFMAGEAAEPYLEWGYMGDARYTEPFFTQTINRLVSRPFNALFRRQTPLDALTQRAADHPGLPLTGLIFHMSRCGSTLASQALAALPDSVVLSEPEILDTLLRRLHAGRPGSPDAAIGLLRGLVAALGQPRRPEDRRLFIKVSPWHAAYIDLLRQAFPATPWLFLYRDPVEVLVSHRHCPGLQMVPGALPAASTIPNPDGTPVCDPLEHGARVLARVMNEALRAVESDGNGRLLNFSELPGALWTTLARHFRLELGAGEQAAMETSCTRYSKEPAQSYVDDGEQKRRGADPHIRAIANTWLEMPYQALEARRKSRADTGSITSACTRPSHGSKPTNRNMPNPALAIKHGMMRR